jgi:translocator protein
MDRFKPLPFVLAILAVGWLIGATNLPGEWYANLAKPSFNPPNWIFAPVWSLLYLLIGLVGWRTWQHDGLGPAMLLWCLQMGLNFAWSPIFFTAHLMELALFIIMALLVAIIVFIARQWSTDRLSAGLFLPYAAWVAFASLLNAAIFVLN